MGRRATKKGAPSHAAEDTLYINKVRELSHQEHRNRISSCAVRILRNMLNGYTVE
jgi:hypothetical protein